MFDRYKARIKIARLKASTPGLLIGANCTINEVSFGANVQVGSDCTLLNSRMGDYTYIGGNSVVCSSTIGKFCSIASSVQIGTGSHPTRSFVSTHPIFYLARPGLGWDLVDKDKREEFTHTDIGSDVWIGARVLIRDGVKIGDGAIVGAGAVVVKDLKPYGIYVGMPAKLLRYRFADDMIEKLLKLRWWDRNMNWIRENAAFFHEADTLLDIDAAKIADRD